MRESKNYSREAKERDIKNGRKKKEKQETK